MNRFWLPWGAIVGLWLTCAVTGAGAQVSTQSSGSVLVFPKVVVNDNWDTTIQIANGANRPTRAVCHYVNGALVIPDLPPGPTNPPIWSQIDFTIHLTRQQPTHWVVSRGRIPGEETVICTPSSPDCDRAGFVSLVPPVDSGFSGELVCIEVDASGAPWTGNGLRGQATLTHLATGEVAKYPAIGLAGFQTNDADGNLCLGGAPGDGCLLGAEYAACPSRWRVSHPSDYDDSSVDGAVSRTNLTVVPCSVDFDTQNPSAVTLNFRITNELEQTFSTSRSVTCWEDFQLGTLDALFTREVVGDWLQTEVRVTNPSVHGIMLVQQTTHEQALPSASSQFSVVATTPHQDGTGSEADRIVLPVEVVP